MSETAAAAAPVAGDPCRLDVYRLALAFQSRAAALVQTRGQGHLRDQLARASVSIALNVAEGAGRFGRADKARFYGMARGSACECAAILDILERNGIGVEVAPARSEVLRIITMLTRLIARMKAA